MAQQETSNLSIAAHDWALRECPLGPCADIEAVLKPSQSEEGGQSVPCFLASSFLYSALLNLDRLASVPSLWVTPTRQHIVGIQRDLSEFAWITAFFFQKTQIVDILMV